MHITSISIQGNDSNIDFYVQNLDFNPSLKMADLEEEALKILRNLKVTFYRGVPT